MANVLISDISTELSTPDGDEWIEVETSAGVSKKIKVSSLFSYRSMVGKFGMDFYLPAKTLKLNGALVSRTTYATLWAFVNANYSPITEVAWAAGSVGNFSVGDNATSFRLPDFSGLFPRFAGTNSVMTLANATTYFNGGNVCSVANDMVQGFALAWKKNNYSTAISPTWNTDDAYYTPGTTYAGGTTTTGNSTSVIVDDGTHGALRTGGETAPARVSLIPYVIYED